VTRTRVLFAVTSALSFALGMLSLLAGLWYFDAGAELANGLSKEGLLALRPGASPTEVRAIVGEPLFERGATSTSRTWVYRRRGVFGLGVEVYLVISNGSLAGVYVEDSDLLVYRCDTQKCPDTPWRPEILERLPSAAK